MPTKRAIEVAGRQQQGAVDAANRRDRRWGLGLVKVYNLLSLQYCTDCYIKGADVCSTFLGSFDV
ncbi:hypothetical protein D918_05409 [Trichuris suis]|nr:hypothetical protein D918_05409 [Trichuris suis]